ncbi:hypothetical protein SAMN02745883_02386 [Caminicella sporogenes DSM 14501]|uniref:Uncharacterized protein n=1 Tax=Caminicella sporogenes DSM 14501 TaxID=1121266 RepID=A0A1M6TLW0_9FIRM|nr:hypothetical protein [Caminicella sporogenes]RKD22343.1 hypothetical protein BET04_04735 [Caminicella sporogenes]SHK57886.1 hypothetical protein SAMN02745883_02386 [Caminicella sporogenes DSM 14501]
MTNVKVVIIAVFIVLAMLAGFIYKSNKPKIPVKEYEALCLELAKIDDQIARNELEGNTINGKKVVFPPKDESIKYRYEVFLDMYKKYSREDLEKEKEHLLKRLETSKQYLNEESQDLELILQ